MKTTHQIKRDARELWRTCIANGAVDEARTRVVVDRIIGTNRAGVLAVLKDFARRLRLDAAKRTATVASAAPLDAQLCADVERALTRLHGGPVATTFVVGGRMLIPPRARGRSRIRMMMRHTWLVSVAIVLLCAGVAGAALYVASRPTTVTIAAGPPNSEDAKLVQALANQSNTPLP